MVFKKFFSCALSIAISLSFLLFQGVSSMNDFEQDDSGDLSIILDTLDNEASLLLEENDSQKLYPDDESITLTEKEWIKATEEEVVGQFSDDRAQKLAEKEEELDDQEALVQFKPEIHLRPFFKELIAGLENGRMDFFIDSLDQFVKNIPSLLSAENEREAFYHTVVLLLFRLAGYDVKSDYATGNGRVDIKMTNLKKSMTYFLEFKVNDRVRDDSQKKILLDALKQILENKYYESSKIDEIPMMLAGISFFGSSKKKQDLGDDFEALSCLALKLHKPGAYSLKAYPYAGQGDCWGSKDTDWKAQCSDEHFKELFVIKSENDFEFLVQHHQCVPKLAEALLNPSPNRFDLFSDSVKSLINEIGYLQKLCKKEYYLGVLYAVLAACGFEPQEQKGCLIVTTDSNSFVFSSSFIETDDQADAYQYAVASFFNDLAHFNQDSFSSRLYFIHLGIRKNEGSSSVDPRMYALERVEQEFFLPNGMNIGTISDGNKKRFCSKVVSDGVLQTPSTLRMGKKRHFSIGSGQSSKKIKFDSSSGDKQ